MSLDYIRRCYGVPAYEGATVVFDYPAGAHREGTIVGADQARLMVQFPDENHPLPLHPTWRTTYPGSTSMPTTDRPEPPQGTTVRTRAGSNHTRHELGWHPGPWNWVGLLEQGAEIVDPPAVTP